MTKWGVDEKGKNFPAEYRVWSRSNSGAEVSVDQAHEQNGPGVAHVGFQTTGKTTPSGMLFWMTFLYFCKSTSSVT
ncbi:polymorphic toxin type 47 domain-containing protein [Silvimonas amylolytica]|uniref:polymorphic toxin type 47 domain-containing protein n=1 Tax=Silvimonas amylolytica TaxID=449663 RepID=UPI003570EFB8